MARDEVRLKVDSQEKHDYKEASNSASSTASCTGHPEERWKII